jgi:hypothetical protein
VRTCADETEDEAERDGDDGSAAASRTAIDARFGGAGARSGESAAKRSGAVAETGSTDGDGG